jgi:glycosyltransferase involved in cell wall biosynthesis
MLVAYIVNHYPKVSHSFIRREVQALERLGVQVQRIALRGWDTRLVDHRDQAELEATEYVLKRGFGPLVVAWVWAMLAHPVRFARALRLVAAMGLDADKSLAFHWIYLAEACLVTRMVARSGARHLHAHFGTNSSTVAMLAGVVADLPFSFTAHGPEEFERARGIGLSEKIRRAAFVVGISSFGRSQLYRWVAHDHWHKVHVVHCGLDPTFHEGSEQAEPDADRFVCVGRLCEEKGQLLLLSALRQLLDRGFSAQLVLAGDGDLRVAVEKRIATLGLDGHVRITGWISSDQVRSEILGARAMVLPSFAEGLPVVIMEAMALRRSVVSTYVAGIPELLVDGESGWLVPAGDVGRLADAMQACLQASVPRLIAMGEAARRRVLARHDVDVEAARLADLFLHALHAAA